MRDVIRHQTAQKRMAGRELSRGARPDTVAFAAAGQSPIEHSIELEQRARLQTVLAALPRDYGEILRLARFEGLTLREAGDRMGRSREAAKKLYGRALARFAELYRKMEGEAHE